MQTNNQEISNTNSHSSAEEFNNTVTNNGHHLQQESMQINVEGKMPNADDSITMEEVDLRSNAKGLRVRSMYLEGERFVPWDLPGKCDSCGSQTADIHHTMQNWGILIVATRLRKPLFIVFDRPISEQKPFSTIRLR